VCVLNLPKQFVKTTVTACICPLVRTHTHTHLPHPLFLFLSSSFSFFFGVFCSVFVRLLWRALLNKQEATNSASVSGLSMCMSVCVCVCMCVSEFVSYISDCILICLPCAAAGHSRIPKDNICWKRPLNLAPLVKSYSQFLSFPVWGSNRQLKQLIWYAIQIFQL